MAGRNGGGVGDVEHGDRLEESDDLVQRCELDSARLREIRAAASQGQLGYAPRNAERRNDETDGEYKDSEGEGVADEVEDGGLH